MILIKDDLKDTTDKVMIREMMKWAAKYMKSHYEPTTIVVITSDVDFRGVINHLVCKIFCVVLAHEKSTTKNLLEAPNKYVIWDQFVRGRWAEKRSEFDNLVMTTVLVL